MWIEDLPSYRDSHLGPCQALLDCRVSLVEPSAGTALELLEARRGDVDIQPVDLPVGPQGLDTLGINAHETEATGCGYLTH